MPINSDEKYFFYYKNKDKKKIKKVNFQDFYAKKSGKSCINVVIDSRQAVENSLFVALEKDNAKRIVYIKDAIKRGAKWIICKKNDIQKIKCDKEVYYIYDNNVKKLLQDLASYKIKILKNKGTRIIGITGSLGKTTTREMIKIAINDNKKKIYATTNNYNNDIGLPITILNAPIETNYLILELGMNHKKEIDFLANIALPDIAIITNISFAHIGNFKNLDEIAKAKAEIFHGMNKDGVVILNKFCDYYDFFKKEAKKHCINTIITVGIAERKGDDNDVDIFSKNFSFTSSCGFLKKNNIDGIKYKVFIKGRPKPVICFLNGMAEHNILNSLFSYAVAVSLKLNLNKVSNRLKEFKIVEGRGNFEKIYFYSNNIKNKKMFKKNILIINDCYNSSPKSLKSSINTLFNIKKYGGTNFSNRRIVIIIGDMLELGKYSDAFHKDIADFINNLLLKDENFKFKKDIKFIFVGKKSKIIYDNLNYKKKELEQYCCYYTNTEELIENNCINNILKDKDIVLFKASHRMEFNKILEKLRTKD